MKNFKNILKILLFVCILIFPMTVNASSDTNEMPIQVALMMEAFVSIHFSIFFIYPISKMISKDVKKTFIILFAIRAGILLFFDFFVTTYISVVDFVVLFFGAFIIVPLVALITKKDISGNNKPVNNDLLKQGENNELHCLKCGTPTNGAKFCTNCGIKLTSNNIAITISNKSVVKKDPVKYKNFEKIYKQSEDKMIKQIIEKEMKKAGFTTSNSEIPKEILNKKTLLNIVLAFLFFVFIASIFIHYPIYVYIVEIIILILLFKILRKIDLYSYIKKQIELRPEEKISNVVINIKNSCVTYNPNKQLSIFIIVILFFSIFLFATPKIFYEPKDDGYAVRYYIFGITNFTKAKIPETYRGKKVVSLRGNTFSNMFLLRKVELPDSITEIRGQAFKNCIFLKEVNIPKNLEYLGGGAFRNAKSINEIELPDSLTYLGGESFYGASNLKKIKLSNNLEEIRGDSFEYCTSLEKIKIPDSVTRIGGHAFYGDSSLSEVEISQYSQLNEIGSSAFRLCPKLYQITIPRDTYVNERAFKESPTTVERYASGSIQPIYIGGNKNWLEKNKEYIFSDYNISIRIDSHAYTKDNITYGSMIITELDNKRHFDFHYALSEQEREETNIVTNVYNNNIYKIEDYNENGVLLSITKNADYSKSYTSVHYRIFGKIGDNYILSNTNQIIKLENITNKMGRFDYYFSCNGQPFDHPIGNGFYTTAVYENVRIQMTNFYPGQAVSMKIYYN